MAASAVTTVELTLGVRAAALNRVTAFAGVLVFARVGGDELVGGCS